MLKQEEQQQLLELAAASIKEGLESGHALKPNLSDYAETLQNHQASFVTLKIQGQLRGCIGSLEAHRPLLIDVAENAFAAAFRDPRFSPLQRHEFEQLDYHISLLSPYEPIQFESEADLLTQIRPGIDGLVLEDKGYRGTFLPAVWESLPDAERFLAQLKVKAGFPTYYWSDTIKVYRYTVEDIKPD